MDYNTALKVLEREVVVPAFLSRLAEHGIRPRTPREVSQWLKYGASIYKWASNRYQFGVPRPDETPERFVKRASNMNPQVRRAIKTVLGL